MFPDFGGATPYYKYLRTWHVILLPFTTNAIDKTSYAMRQGSSLFTIASARAFPLATSNESGVDVNSSSSARSISRLDVDTGVLKFDLYDVAVLPVLGRT